MLSQTETGPASQTAVELGKPGNRSYQLIDIGLTNR